VVITDDRSKTSATAKSDRRPWGLIDMRSDHSGAPLGASCGVHEHVTIIAQDHVAVAAKDLSDEDCRAIHDAQYPPGFEHLDALMDND
jgi:hypothetical protein